MTSPIDTAYVDIVAREKSLDKLRKDIDQTLKKVEKDADENLKKIDKDFDDTFEAIDKHFTDMAKDAEKSFERVSESAEHAFRDVDDHIDRHGRRARGRFAALTAAVGDAFDEIGEKVKRGLTQAFGAVGGGIARLGGFFGQLGGFVGGAIGSSPLLALILVLTPAIIALAAALSQLIGLVGVLPSGLGVLVAAIVPIVIAFQNFGEAVSALAEGDIDKINEALKKLSPSAAAVAREVAKTLPVLRAFQKLIQESFFAQVQGSFTKLINNGLVLLTGGFQRVAMAAGQFVKQFVNAVTTADNIQVFNEVFATTARIIQNLTGPIIRLFDAINSSVHESLPFVERLANALGTAVDKFAAFIDTSIETGAFDKFIEDAFTTLKELLDLLKATGGLIGTLFAGTEEAGHSFIQTLTDIITKLDQFFQSKEGQDFLKDLSFLTDALAASLGAVVTAFMFMDQSSRTSISVLGIIGKAFTDLIKVIGDFFGKLPEKIEEWQGFLRSIPERLLQFVHTVFDSIFTFIGTQIGLILFGIQVVPQKIVEFIGSIPQRIGESLASTGPTILDIFKKAFEDATVFIITKFDEIVAFIRSVPDKIVALGPVFLQAGKNLITSFMNGFRAVGSFIGDIAGDIVGAVRSFLNRAIDKINSGIAAVDAVLPGDLARIPRLASGALIHHRSGGILANVGEGSEDEVVSPLSTLEEIIRKAFGGDDPRDGGMTVNFGPNSINVSFEGAVPTEGEARTVGAAVADGIASRLAQRNIRTQLRAA